MRPVGPSAVGFARGTRANSAANYLVDGVGVGKRDPERVVLTARSHPVVWTGGRREKLLQTSLRHRSVSFRHVLR